MRALIFISIIALVNYYVASRLFYLSPLPKVHFLWPILLAAVLMGLEMLDLRSGLFASNLPVKWILSCITGTVLCLLFYFLIADILLIVAALIPNVNIDAVRNYMFGAVIAFTLFSLVIGVWQARQPPEVKNVTIRIKNLPPAFEGYKILQLSDLHIGNTIRAPYVEKVVKIADAQNADLVALTGDFADGSVEELKDISATLKNIRSKDGTFFITGNHEYYHDLNNWLPYYRALGFTVLTNEHRIITKGNDKLAIAGVTDYSTRHSDLPDRINVPRAAENIPADAVKILLMHQANLYRDAEANGFDLVLSGHTHKGQFFPWTLVVPFFHHFAHGLGTYKDTQVYVNAGTGYWGPPLRGLNPAEITVLTLTRG